MDRMRRKYCASLAVAAWFGVPSCALATPHAALAATGNVVLVGAALTVCAALMTVVGVRWSLWHSLLLSGWTVAAAILMERTANAVPLLLIAVAAIAVTQWAQVLEKKQSRRRYSK